MIKNPINFKVYSTNKNSGTTKSLEIIEDFIPTYRHCSVFYMSSTTPTHLFYHVWAPLLVETNYMVGMFENKFIHRGDLQVEYTWKMNLTQIVRWQGWDLKISGNL